MNGNLFLGIFTIIKKILTYELFFYQHCHWPKYNFCVNQTIIKIYKPFNVLPKNAYVFIFYVLIKKNNEKALTKSFVQSVFVNAAIRLRIPGATHSHSKHCVVEVNQSLIFQNKDQNYTQTKFICKIYTLVKAAFHPFVNVYIYKPTNRSE